jgi:hypothetical protein
VVALPSDLFDAACHYVGDAYRNIASLRKSRNLFARIGDDEADAQAAITAELATRPHRDQPLLNQPFEPWYGVIGFPFVAHHWGQSRYSDGSFGIWYGSREIETTVHETVHHFRIELAGRGWDRHERPIVRERLIGRAHVDALAFDLCSKSKTYPALVDGDDYTFTQAIGRSIHAGRHPGLLAPSARRAGGVNVDIFDPVYLSNPRDVCYLTYRYTPDGRITVEREPSDIWLTL